MKKLTYMLANVLFAVFAVHLFGAEGVAMAALLPAGTNQTTDLDRVKQWSQNYFRRVQSKIIFGEAWTGTVMASDGPRESDKISGSPIYQVNDLSNRNGNVVTFTLIKPLFPDSESRLNSGRVKGQIRVGSEQKGAKAVVQIPLSTHFESVAEEDVEIGKQAIAMGTMYQEMVNLLSDYNASYMDDDTIEAFYQGHSRHLYENIAAMGGAADGDPVVGSDSLGVTAPAEHPNTYAWVPNSGDTAGQLVKAASNSTADIQSLFAQITSGYSFSYDLLSQIALRVRLEKIVGSTYNFENGTRKTYVKVLADPIGRAHV